MNTLRFALLSAILATSGFAQKHETFSYGKSIRHKLDVFPQKAIVAAIAAAAEAAAELDAATDTDPVTETEPDATTESDAETEIDVPTGAPVLIFVHGGGWTVGAKSQYRYLGKMFQKRGLVVVMINYRLYPGATFPDFPEDVAAAVAWVSKNIEAHGGDPKKLFLMGHSSGAHSVALVGLDDKYLKNVGVDIADIPGIIAISGPMNLKKTQMMVLKQIRGKSDEYSFRPINFVDGDEKTEPPFLLLHGKRDPLVPVKQSREFEAKIREKGGRVKGIYYPKHDHITIIGGFSEKFEEVGRVILPVMQFIESDGDLEQVSSPLGRIGE